MSVECYTTIGKMFIIEPKELNGIDYQVNGLGCPNHKKLINNKDRFCSECGTKIEKITIDRKILISTNRRWTDTDDVDKAVSIIRERIINFFKDNPLPNYSIGEIEDEISYNNETGKILIYLDGDVFTVDEPGVTEILGQLDESPRTTQVKSGVISVLNTMKIPFKYTNCAAMYYR